jgi:hypothetical protein
LNTDELVAKRANLERIKEFSKNLNNYNRQTISQQTKLPPSAEKHDITISQQKYNSKRQKAIEFAKNVPKPKVAAQPSQRQPLDGSKVRGNGDYFDEFEADDGFGYPSSSNNSHQNVAGNMSFGGEEYKRESRLLELEAQHNSSKAQIDAIRKNLGLK